MQHRENHVSSGSCENISIWERVHYAVRVSASGDQIVEPAYTLNALGSFSSAPINMGAATDKVYLTIYATGLSAAGMPNLAVTVNGVSTQVLYAGNSG